MPPEAPPWSPPAADAAAYLRDRWPTRAAMEAEEAGRHAPFLFTEEERRMAWPDAVGGTTLPEGETLPASSELATPSSELRPTTAANSLGKNKPTVLPSVLSNVLSFHGTTIDGSELATVNGVPVHRVESLAVADASPRTPTGHALIARAEAAIRPHRKRAMREHVRHTSHRLLASLAAASCCGVPLRVSMDNTTPKDGSAPLRPLVRLLLAAGVAFPVAGGDWRAGRQTRIALSPDYAAGLSLADFHYPGLEATTSEEP